MCSFVSLCMDHIKCLHVHCQLTLPVTVLLAKTNSVHCSVISFCIFQFLAQFIAHPNCQQVIISQFYKQLLFVRDKSAVYRTFLFALLFLLYPFLAVLHVYSDRQKIKTFVRIP